MAAADESQKKSTTREYYEAFLIAVIFVNFARIFAFQAFKIPSGSMEDNLKVGDHIIVNKFIFGPMSGPLRNLVPIRDIRRGDIIVFRYPLQPETDFVKRVIGLPGDTISIRDKVVYANGKALDEPYVVHTDPLIFRDQFGLPEQYRVRDQLQPFVVPQGHYFAMGDNRDQSSDSRYWGTVQRSLIKGRAFMVYWSFDMKPPPPGSSNWERAKELWNVLRYFGPKTRWHRSIYIVDKNYHYTPGVSTYGNE